MTSYAPHSDLKDLGQQLGLMLRARNSVIATAESCTGGWIAQAITSVSGSSDWFNCGLVTYSNDSKVALLGVEEELLVRHGAVSEQVALAMIDGVMARTGADCAIATTGIAGPGGGTADKPVGTVWIGLGIQGRKSTAKCYFFSGDRESVRHQTAHVGLSWMIDELDEAS